MPKQTYLNNSTPTVLATDTLANPRILWTANPKRCGAIIRVVGGGPGGPTIQFATKESRPGITWPAGAYIAWGESDNCTFELRAFAAAGIACALEITEVITKE